MLANFKEFGTSDYEHFRINRELLHNLLLNCTKEMVNFVSANLEGRKKQWSESCMLSEEIEALQKERTRLSARKFTIYDDYRNGNSSREKYLHNLEKIQERLAELDKMMGYASYNNFAHVIANGQYFLIRCNDKKTAGILGYTLDNVGELDCHVCRILS